MTPTAVILLLATAACVVSVGCATPPHIVHIMADDTGVSAHNRSPFNASHIVRIMADDM